MTQHREIFKNDSQTTLNGAVLAGDGTVTVADATQLPATEFFRIGGLSIDALPWRLRQHVDGVRGVEGTTAAGHNTGARFTRFCPRAACSGTSGTTTRYSTAPAATASLTPTRTASTPWTSPGLQQRPTKTDYGNSIIYGRDRRFDTSRARGSDLDLVGRRQEHGHQQPGRLDERTSGSWTRATRWCRCVAGPPEDAACNEEQRQRRLHRA